MQPFAKTICNMLKTPLPKCKCSEFGPQMREGRENKRVCPYYNLFSCDAEQQSPKNLENVHVSVNTK